MSLPAYYVFTGCDSVSAFASKRDLLGFTLLKKRATVPRSFSDTWTKPTKLVVDEFICHT